MSITWPPTLPDAFDAQGLEITMPDNVIRQSMETGPPKQRRRDTSAPYKIQGRITMTVAQLVIFEDFFTNVIKSGALQFDWKHPYTLAPARFRIMSTPRIVTGKQIGRAHV